MPRPAATSRVRRYASRSWGRAQPAKKGCASVCRASAGPPVPRAAGPATPAGRPVSCASDGQRRSAPVACTTCVRALASRLRADAAPCTAEPTRSLGTAPRETMAAPKAMLSMRGRLPSCRCATSTERRSGQLAPPWARCSSRTAVMTARVSTSIGQAAVQLPHSLQRHTSWLPISAAASPASTSRTTRRGPSSRSQPLGQAAVHCPHW